MAGFKLNTAYGKPLTKIKTKSQGDSIWTRDIEIGQAFPEKEKKQFFHLLATLMDSGLSITESMDILIEQARKRKLKALLERIKGELQEGRAFSACLQAQGRYFSEFEYQSVRMGESSGMLNHILKDLARYHEKRIRLKRKFVQAFSYPVVVILIAGGVMGFMIGMVVPMFRDIFDRFDTELPGITKMVLWLSDLLLDWGLWAGLTFLVLGILIYRIRKTETFKKLSSGIILRIPLIGGLIKKIQLSRFCYTLALMLKSKVNLDQALDLLNKIMKFYPIQSTIGPIKAGVVEGKTLYESVSPYGIYPMQLKQMIRVGERTARLDTMLENLGKNLEEEGEQGINTLTNLMEPILIVVLGLVVGLILVSMYLPMFELSNSIQ